MRGERRNWRPRSSTGANRFVEVGDAFRGNFSCGSSQAAQLPAERSRPGTAASARGG